MQGMTVAELIAKLQLLPGDWLVRATKSGSTLEINDSQTGWHDSGHRYGYVFIDERETQLLTRR